MADFRSEAEIFVTEFIDYVNQYDILDMFDKRTQKMTQSPGVSALIMKAKSVFPDRKPGGESAKIMAELPEEIREEAIVAATNIVDSRQMFANKIKANGGVRELLSAVLAGDEAARELATEFIKAESGQKEFSDDKKD